MPVKFYCPKCERRFVDWGAEKLGFLCPSCEGVKLLKVGERPEAEAEAPTLKRKPARPARSSGGKSRSETFIDESGGEGVGRGDYVGLPDEEGGDNSGPEEDSDMLSADGGSATSLDEMAGFESVDQDE